MIDPGPNIPSESQSGFLALMYCIGHAALRTGQWLNGRNGPSPTPKVSQDVFYEFKDAINGKLDSINNRNDQIATDIREIRELLLKK